MHVTWSTNQRQVHVDFKIEKILHRLWKEARINTIVVARQQTLKELAAPNMENQLLWIIIDNNVNFELKFEFIHPLPIFNGLAREDPHTYLKEFHMVCIGMKSHGVDKKQVKIKAFPFSLKGAAKHDFSPFFLVPLELGIAWKRFSLKSISQPLELLA